VALDTQSVRTMAELRARLYVLPPGTPVAVSVQAPGGPQIMNLTLSASS
jgi:S1-C subfamily serine protease